MVGALADWFAVTALFKHPLGIPIPHTAIIPARKDRVGKTLGAFVQRNFLNRDVIAAKLRSIHAAERLARWMLDPGERRGGSPGSWRAGPGGRRRGGARRGRTAPAAVAR